jgi:predicted dehydrogenase
MEAVIVAVPIPLNAEFAGRALKAKKHVLAAKPFALTLEQGLALKETVARATAKFMVNYEFRHSPFIEAIHSQVKAGAIGKLQLMWWNMFRMPFRGVYALRESSGGALVAEVCHWFDLFHLFNSGEVFTRICAFGGLDVLGKQQKIEDNAVCIIEYANAVRGSINFTYFTDQPEHNTFGLVGDRGKISGNTEEAGRYILYNGPEQNRTVVTINPRLAHQGHLGFDVSHRRFLAAIREDLDVNEHEAEAGFESLLISLAAQRSIDTGAIVTREQMLR